jgi:hypothetical protein
MRLTHHHFVVDQARGTQHHEHRVTVGLDLGALMWLQRVLHGQVVQTERLLHLAQQRQVWLVQPSQTKVPGSASALAMPSNSTSPTFCLRDRPRS